MRKVLFIAVAVVCSLSAVSLAAVYTVTPWRYGAIVWVQTPSVAVQRFANEAARAVKDVFSFWEVPVPVPAASWASPTQTSSEGWSDTVGRMMATNPMIIFAGSSDPGASGMEAMLGLPIPCADLQSLLLILAPSWSGAKIAPVTLGGFATAEAMNRLFGDYTFAGFLGGASPYAVARSQQIGQMKRHVVLSALSNPETIVLATEADPRPVLRHEIAHWACWLWCASHRVEFAGLPEWLAEGFAEYTADSLMHDDRWRTVADAWAKDGTPVDVPRPLRYEIGASIVSLLVHQKGKQGLMNLIGDPTTDWDETLSSMVPEWHKTYAAPVSDEGCALYEASCEDLSLCVRLLAPVLSQKARDSADRVLEGRGTLQDIVQFWTLVSKLPPEPSDASWQALIARIPSFGIVQGHDSDPDVRMIRARVEVNLQKYGASRDWDDFYPWFLKGLRQVVAHYGTLEATGSAAAQSG